MPTYGYECNKCKQQFEVFQRITDDPLTIHEGCGGELRRLLYPVGIVFKGPGFYVNDYGKNGGKNATTAPAHVPDHVSPAKPEASSGAKPETKTPAATGK